MLDKKVLTVCAFSTPFLFLSKPRKSSLNLKYQFSKYKLLLPKVIYCVLINSLFLRYLGLEIAVFVYQKLPRFILLLFFCVKCTMTSPEQSFKHCNIGKFESIPRETVSEHSFSEPYSFKRK